jgi:Sulfotransferase domain
MTVTRIAMWSGPRNISTALLRAWGNRADTWVCDEPLYAHYLLTTGHTDHPGYEETIRRHETDWRAVVRQLLGPIPGGKTIFYQKQMAHHLLPDVDLAWVNQLSNGFLIRAPEEVLTSLAEFLPAPTAEETGLPHQLRLFEQVIDETGVAPPVVDARDVLENPRGMLRALCARLGVPFVDQMLSWPAGPRDTDGAWAPHWYGKLYETTGFGRYHSRTGALPHHLRPVLDQIRPLYDRLFEQRLQPAAPDVAAPTLTAL